MLGGGLEGLRFGVRSLEFGVWGSEFCLLSSRGCGPSQPRCTEINTGFTAPTERTPSRESASNVPRVVATMRDGSASNGVRADSTRIAKI
jgi:hypothetical protein